MADKQHEPKTLQEAITYFSDPDNCLAYLVPRLWPNGVTCPRCGRTDPMFLANQQRWQCKSRHPKRQFSAKVGTVMEDSPIPLEKWLPAIWALVNDKNGISSWELHRMLGVTQKAAWFMLHRIRVGLGGKNDGTKLGNNEGGGGVEVDETFHYCPVKSRTESVGWDFQRSSRPCRWPEGRIKWAFSRKA